jgi:hypothetical protein
MTPVASLHISGLAVCIHRKQIGNRKRQRGKELTLDYDLETNWVAMERTILYHEVVTAFQSRVTSLENL